MKDVIKVFKNLQVYNEHLQNSPVNSTFSGMSLSSQTDDVEFTGTKSWEEATARLLEGDKESAEKIEGATHGRKINANIKSTFVKPKIQRRMAGFMPSVPAYCAGSKRCMYRYKKETRQQKVVTIVYNIGALCDIPATSIAKAAYNVLRAVLKVEASGTKVNFYTSAVSTADGQAVGSVVKIKDSSQYFNFLKMAYPMVHPSMFRRQAFRYKEVTDGIGRAFAYGYGSTIRDTNEIQRRVVDSNPSLKDAIFMSFYEVRNMNDDEVFETIKKKSQK